MDELQVDTTTEVRIRFERGVAIIPDPVITIAMIADSQAEDQDSHVALYEAISLAMDKTGVTFELEDGHERETTHTEKFQIATRLLAWSAELGKDFALTLSSAVSSVEGLGDLADTQNLNGE